MPFKNVLILSCVYKSFACPMCTWCWWRPEGGVRSLGTGVPSWMRAAPWVLGRAKHPLAEQQLSAVLRHLSSPLIFVRDRPSLLSFCLASQAAGFAGPQHCAQPLVLFQCPSPIFSDGSIGHSTASGSVATQDISDVR